jgi:hypothetical protein
MAFHAFAQKTDFSVLMFFNAEVEMPGLHPLARQRLYVGIVCACVRHAGMQEGNVVPLLLNDRKLVKKARVQ